MSTQLEEKLNRILSEKKEKIIPENIRAGISIFDVEGSFETLDTSDATATPSDVLDGKIAYSANNTRIEGTYIPLDTSDATATETDILLGKTAYVNGEKLTGTYEVKGEEITITPSNVEQTEEGLFSKITVTGDENLISENIKKGVSIFNVEGQFEGQSEETYNVLVVPSKPKYGLSPSIKKIKSIDFAGVTNAQSAFSGQTALEEILELKNTGEITNMLAFFNDCNKLKNVPDIDTSKVTNMGTMFNACKSLTKIPDLKTENVTNMSQLFRDCSNIVDVSLSNTSNVTNIQGMFYNCTKFKNIIGTFNTSNVTSMSETFYKCRSLEELPVLDTSKVTTMLRAFYLCDKLLSLPELDMPNNTNLDSTFASCKSIETISLKNTSKVTIISGAFQFCYKLKNLSQIDGEKINSAGASVFNECYALENFNGILNFGKAFTSKTTGYPYYILNFSASTNLTYESLINIIDNLYDLNLTYNVANGGTLYTQKLILGSTNLAKLTAEEIAIATAKRMDH